MKSETEVLAKFAEEIAERVSRKAITVLRTIRAPYCHGGDRFGLKDAWEEICVHLHVGTYPYSWEEYDELAYSVVYQIAEKLKKHELLAVWFQTDEGCVWDCMPIAAEEHYNSLGEAEKANLRQESEEPAPSMDDVTNYIKSHLYDKAGEYSNKRIRAYLER